MIYAQLHKDARPVGFLDGTPCIDGYISYEGMINRFCPTGAILNNNLIEVFPEDWEQVAGTLEDEDGYPLEVMQWYIISQNSAENLRNYTEEVIYYNSTLDLYLLAVTHYGTAWDYVHTDFKVVPEA
jgi:hypothetical protein